jgi:dipeptidyl aminopeptidase/acylaminoacyl peptidase
MGWSNGGLVTSWVITQTKRFKAASVGAGPIDLIGQTSAMFSLSDDLGTEFWDNVGVYLEYSPIIHTKGVSTPTLIQHGGQDQMVPLSQGHLLFNALKCQGTPAKMLIYPNASHIPRSPKQIIDIAEQNLEWFNQYLQSHEVPAVE